MFTARCCHQVRSNRSDQSNRRSWVHLPINLAERRRNFAPRSQPPRKLLARSWSEKIALNYSLLRSFLGVTPSFSISRRSLNATSQQDRPHHADLGPRAAVIMPLHNLRHVSCWWTRVGWTRRTREEAAATSRGVVPSTGCGSRLDRWLPTLLSGGCAVLWWLWPSQRRTAGACRNSPTSLLPEFVRPRLYSYYHCRNHVCFHDDIISKAFRWWTRLNWLPVSCS
jgi:hypothetical protein